MTNPGDADARHDRRLLLPAAVAGMAAIVTLPMSALAPDALVVLVFALPLLLFVAASMYARVWLRWLAIGLGAALLVALATGVAAFVPTAVVLLGPIVAVVLVGTPLREVDVVAAGGFLMSGTVAVIGGFATRGMPGSIALVLGVAVVGLVIVTVRLRDAERVG